MKKRSGRASQNQHHETLIYVVKNAQTHAVPMGKALNEARVYRTTDRSWKLGRVFWKFGNRNGVLKHS